jgi:predicted N-acetyltransferase YhbS
VLDRLEARIILLGYGVGYSILTALTFYWTFGFEHDAQYQLMLFLIPMFGFPTVAIAGLAAAMIR